MEKAHSTVEPKDQPVKRLTDAEKLKRYEDMIAQLKRENEQLEEDLNAAFERENYLQGLLENQKAAQTNVESQRQKQSRIDLMKELETLHNSNFQKNREISQKIVEISNLGFQLKQKSEENESLVQQLEYYQHQSSQIIDNFKRKTQVSILQKSPESLMPCVSAGFKVFQHRLQNIESKIQRMKIGFNYSLADKEARIHQLTDSNQSLTKGNRDLREQNQRLVDEITQLKTEMEQIQIITQKTAVGSQNEIQSLRQNLQDYVADNKRRIETLKRNCEEFLLGLFNSFSVLESLGKKEIMQKINLEQFFESLRRITSKKFCDQQKTKVTEQRIKGISKETEVMPSKAQSNIKTDQSPLKPKKENQQSEPCPNCFMFEANVVNCRELLKEQEALFNSQQQIWKAKKRDLLQQCSELNKMLKNVTFQHQRDFKSLNEKLAESNDKVKALETDYQSLKVKEEMTEAQNKKLLAENSRLIDNFKAVSEQKRQLTQATGDMQRLREQMMITNESRDQNKAEVRRVSEQLSVFRQKLSRAERTIEAIEENRRSLEIKAQNLKHKLNQKECYIKEMKAKISTGQQSIICSKHQYAQTSRKLRKSSRGLSLAKESEDQETNPQNIISISNGHLTEETLGGRREMMNTQDCEEMEANNATINKNNWCAKPRGYSVNRELGMTRSSVSKDRRKVEDQSRVSKIYTIDCMACVQDYYNGKANNLKSKLQKALKTCERKTDIIRALQQKLEETELAASQIDQRFTKDSESHNNKLKVLRKEINTLRSQLDSTTLQMNQLGNHTIELFNKLSEVISRRKLSGNNQVSKTRAIEGKFVESCKILDMSIDDLGLFIDPHSIQKSNANSFIASKIAGDFMEVLNADFDGNLQIFIKNTSKEFDELVKAIGTGNTR